MSHDRMFLDNTVNTVYEIEYGKTFKYNGNYSQFVKEKNAFKEQQQKKYIAQQKEIERLQRMVDRFKGKPTKVSMARSKQKAIEHMEIIEAPDRQKRGSGRLRSASVHL